MRWGKALGERYRDVLASIYIYNEHRGYTSLDRVLEAVRARCPDEPAFIAEIESHRADERKHYLMFKRWFERQGRMPLAVGRSCGHIDRFIQWVFGCPIDELDTAAVIADGGLFEQLCRVIALTEQRGYAQLAILLRSPLVLADPVLTRIFRIIYEDEPSHFGPYCRWLERHDRPTALWRERAADWCIHKILMLAVLPVLFLDAGASRRTRWHDDGEDFTPDTRGDRPAAAAFQELRCPV
ncbi:MAG: ferritin-like domain-containing protein [Novosphingobium sp.]|nr:ferritin-like domain-containing protein [Novosphingobium sp.]